MTMKVNGPDFSVNFPDGTDKATIDRVMRETMAKRQTASAPENNIGGSLKSFGTGLEKGAIALAGLPGDIQDLSSRGMSWLFNKAGADPERTAQTQQALSNMPLTGPTSPELINTATQAGMPVHEPQTKLESGMETVGSFLPSAMLGPGSVARKLAVGVGAGAASEGAGQAAQAIDPSLEPYARLGGALLGGGVASLIRRGAPAAAATTEQLKAIADRLYGNAKLSGQQVTPETYSEILDRVGQAAMEAGANKRLTPMARGAMKELVSNEGRPQSVQDIDLARQNLKLAEGSANPQERRIAKIMTKEFDQAVEDLAPNDLAAARKAYSKFKQAEFMDTQVGRATVKGETKYTQAGFEHAIRQKFANLFTSDAGAAKLRTFPQDVQEAFYRIAMPSRTEKTMRWIGKFAPTGPVSAIPSMLGAIGGGGYVAGMPGALAGAGIAGAGIVAKKIANAMAMKNFRMADELIRRGPAELRQMKGQARQNLVDALVRMLAAPEGVQASTAANPNPQLQGANGQ